MYRHSYCIEILCQFISICLCFGFCVSASDDVKASLSHCFVWVTLLLHLSLQFHLTCTNICRSTRMKRIVFAQFVAKRLCTNLTWNITRRSMITGVRRETVKFVVESKYMAVHRKTRDRLISLNIWLHLPSVLVEKLTWSTMKTLLSTCHWIGHLNFEAKLVC